MWDYSCSSEPVIDLVELYWPKQRLGSVSFPVSSTVLGETLWAEVCNTDDIHMKAILSGVERDGEAAAESAA